MAFPPATVDGLPAPPVPTVINLVDPALIELVPDRSPPAPPPPPYQEAPPPPPATTRYSASICALEVMLKVLGIVFSPSDALTVNV